MTERSNLNENSSGENNNTRGLEYRPRISRTAKINPLLFLIIIPVIGYPLLGIIVYVFFFDFYQVGYSELSEKNPTVYVELIIIFIPITYGLYPALKSSSKYFRNKGYSNTVIEFELLKKILYITIPIMVSSFLTSGLTYTILHGGGISVLLNNLANLGYFMLLIIVTGTALRLSTHLLRKEFRLYFTKGCCEIISKKEDTLENVKYLSLALDSYNDYLRKNIKFEIKDIKRITSKFIASAPEEKEEIIESICKSLASNKLELTSYIAKSLEVPEAELLVHEPLSQKLKVWGSFLATAIPIAITIIELARR